MHIRDFPNNKLNLPKELKDKLSDNQKTSIIAIEEYISTMGKYIFTNINLDYEPTDIQRIYAWTLRTISAILLRSLYIRNDFVSGMNDRNLLSIYFSLKAWFETVGVLATILDIYEKKLSLEDLQKELAPIFLGNKGKGEFRIGHIEAKNVITMLQKADSFLEKIYANDKEEGDIEKFFTSFYDNLSNPTHPSSDAYEMFGKTNIKSHCWEAFSPTEVKAQIVEHLPAYGAGLMSAQIIENLCYKIFSKNKEQFSKLSADRYFTS